MGATGGRAPRVRGIAAAAMVSCCLLSAVAGFAENPFLGRWAIESFGQAERLVFQFDTDTELVISVGEEETPPQSYAVDLEARRLTLPMSNGEDIVLRYVWQGKDSFVLYMTEGLLEDMVSAFTASLPADANALTNEIIEQLRVAVREVFVRSPFMRGTRVD